MKLLNILSLAVAIICTTITATAQINPTVTYNSSTKELIRQDLQLRGANIQVSDYIRANSGVFTNGVTVGGTLSASSSVVTNNASVGGTLSALNATISNSLSVAGAATVSSLTVTNDASINGTLRTDRVIATNGITVLGDGPAAFSRAFILDGIISPSQITANQNNYNPTGLSTNSEVRLSSDASRTITGIVGRDHGGILRIVNVGSNPIVLASDSASSLATNRISLVSDVTLAANEVITLKYDLVSGKWRPWSTRGGGSGDVTLTGTQTLSNKKIQLKGASFSSDDTYDAAVEITGIVAGEALTQWQAVYLNSDGKWHLADADAVGETQAVGLAVAAASADAAVTVVVIGTIRNDAWNWTPGGVVYLSTTTGDLTQTAPSGGASVQKLGHAASADIVLLNVNSTVHVTQ